MQYSDPEVDDPYQEAAQTCIEYHRVLKNDHNNRGNEHALQIARVLYQHHGPFELDWGSTHESRIWYQGPDGGANDE